MVAGAIEGLVDGSGRYRDRAAAGAAADRTRLLSAGNARTEWAGRIDRQSLGRTHARLIHANGGKGIIPTPITMEIVTSAVEHPAVLAPLPAAFHCLSELPAEPGIGKRGTAGRGQFPVEPGRAVMANLAVEAGRRQDADADVGAVPRKIVGLTARGKIGGAGHDDHASADLFGAGGIHLT